MIVGKVSLSGRKDLYITSNNIFSFQMYDGDILSPLVITYIAAIESFLKGNDNVISHIARIMDRYLDREYCSIWTLKKYSLFN